MRDEPAPKPFVIPIFIPHAGCPHRCIFCNQTRTTSLSEDLPTTAQIDETISRYLSYRKDARRYTEISFYGGNFLGLPTKRMVSYLDHVSQYVSESRIQGIRFSTRPDTITPQRLKHLSPFSVSTVELGVQSMNNGVLKTSQRGHSVEHIHRAVDLLKMHPYRLGLQMMIGLPGDTTETTMVTGERMAGLEPDFVRIYPTLVLEGSPLADWYRNGQYTPMTLEDAVTVTKKLYVLFLKRGIRVIRMGLQATEGLNAGTDCLAGPYHPAFGELVHSDLWLDVLEKEIKNRNLIRIPIDIEMHPRLMSRVKGHKNKNMAYLSEKYAPLQINISTNMELPDNTIRLNGHACQYPHLRLK